MSRLDAARKTGMRQYACDTWTACGISPTGYLRYTGEDIGSNNGNVRDLSQKLYDTIYGMQTGTVADDMGWIMQI